MCLFALLAGFFPRIAFAVYWIARPNIVDSVFGNFIWPLLGLIFLPLTTLLYVILWNTGGHGVTGWEWIFVFFAFLGDLASYGGGARRRGYT